MIHQKVTTLRKKVAVKILDNIFFKPKYGQFFLLMEYYVLHHHVGNYIVIKITITCNNRNSILTEIRYKI